MACPSSGEITMQKIAREKRYNNYNSSSFPSFNLSLKNMSTGTQHGAINNANSIANRPTAFAPYPMSDFYSYDHDKVSTSTPTVFTNSATNNENLSTLTVVGNVSSNGGATVTQRGVVISTSQNPTITNNIDSGTASGTGGSFSVVFDTSSLIVGPNGTVYYCRAYATNSQGTAYGTQRSVTVTYGGIQ